MLLRMWGGRHVHVVLQASCCSTRQLGEAQPDSRRPPGGTAPLGTGDKRPQRTRTHGLLQHFKGTCWGNVSLNSLDRRVLDEHHPLRAGAIRWKKKPMWPLQLLLSINTCNQPCLCPDQEKKCHFEHTSCALCGFTRSQSQRAFQEAMQKMIGLSTQS